MTSEKVALLHNSKFYLIRKLMISMKNISLKEEENKLILVIKKT